MVGSSWTAPCSKPLANLISARRSVPERRLPRARGSSSVHKRCSALPRALTHPAAQLGEGQRSGHSRPGRTGLFHLTATHTNARPFLTRGPFPFPGAGGAAQHRPNATTHPVPSRRGRGPFKRCHPPLRAPLPASLIGRPGCRSPPVPVSATLPC